MSDAGRVSDHGLYRLRHESGAVALIDRSCGGTIHRLRLVAPGRNEPVDILWGDPDLSAPCGETELFRGRPLVPFADRIKGGTYRFEGRDYRLPLNDLSMGDAVHGFLYGEPGTLVTGGAGGSSEVTVAIGTRLEGREGYPWSLDVRQTYCLRADELVYGVGITNRSDSNVPVGAGLHTYFLIPGDGAGGEPAPGVFAPVDSGCLHIPATGYLEVDDALRPTGRVVPVEGSPWDFRTLRPIGSGELDLAFPLLGENGAAENGASKGRAPIRIAGPRYVTSLRMGGAFGMAQVFIPPGREAVAVEPVTAPGECFNRPELGLLVLEPGAAMDAWASITIGRNRLS